MRFLSVIIPVLGLGCALPVAGLARDLNQDEILSLTRQGRIVTLESMMATVHARYPDARLLEAEVEREGSDRGYRYECELLLPDGTVRELEFDAVTGRLLSDQEDD